MRLGVPLVHTRIFFHVYHIRYRNYYILPRDYKAPLSDSIRPTDQRQQLRQQRPHFRGTKKPVWNDETVAAAYIPIAMQAQTLAYERAVLNSMEINDRVTISNPDVVTM